MAEVKARPNESIDQLLRRFKKVVEDSGVLSELRKREYYEKPSVKRKKKQAAARKRHLKRLRKLRPKPKMGNWKWNKDHTKKIELKSYSNTNKPGFNKSRPNSSNTTSNYKGNRDQRNSGYKPRHNPNYKGKQK